MPHKRSLIVLIVTLLLLTVVQYIFAYSDVAVDVYAQYIFYPFQVIRNKIFGFIPFSIGDIIYIAATILIISLIAKWIYYLIKIRTYKRPLLLSLLKTAMIGAIVYIWFFIGWGGNYSKPTLAKHWGMEMNEDLENEDTLVKFNLYLINKLNEYAPGFKILNFKDIEERSHSYYQHFEATNNRLSCINIKPSIFGNMLEYSGIQGYYDPFTGEGQINQNMPSFLLPFTTCHEMAHQAGIAKEEDANFLAFVIGTNSKDTSFVYSAYFNVWLYTNARLRSKDSMLAKSFYKDINPITMGHIYILRERRKKYQSPFSRYSSIFYDNFLKLNKQEKGMDSYDDVVNTAYAWEKRRLHGERSPVSIP